MKTIITHLFDKESDSLDSDTVFGVRSRFRPGDRRIATDTAGSSIICRQWERQLHRGQRSTCDGGDDRVNADAVD